VFKLLLGRPTDLEGFINKRAASVTDQLAGRSKGSVLRANFGAPGGPNPIPLVHPIFRHADADKDGKLSKSEVVAGVKALFKACDSEGKGELTEKELSAALARVLPKQAGPPVAPSLARGLLTQAGGWGRKLTEKGLLAAVEKSFPRFDRDKNGKIDQGELLDALLFVLPAMPPARPSPPVAGKGSEK